MPAKKVSLRLKISTNSRQLRNVLSAPPLVCRRLLQLRSYSHDTLDGEQVSAEVGDRAVRMVSGHKWEYPSRYLANVAIMAKSGNVAQKPRAVSPGWWSYPKVR